MDRLARRHHMYRRSAIIDSNTTPTSLEHWFSIDSNSEVFKFFRYVIEDALAQIRSEEKVEPMTYIILSCLRLLKINLHDYIVSSFHSARKDDQEFEKEIACVKDLLLRFLDFDAPTLEVSLLVRQEAVSAFVVGFTLFFRRARDQLGFAASLITGENETNTVLVNPLLDALSNWSGVSYLLREEKPDSHDTEREKVAKREMTANPEAKKFLDLLLDFVVMEAKKKASTRASDKIDTPPDVSPAVRLLLSLQRSIIGNFFGQNFLQAYATSLFEKCTLLLDFLKDSHKALLARDEKGTCTFDTILHDSVLGTVLQAAAIAFNRKDFVKKLDFASAMLPVFIRLLQSLDSINCQLASAKVANRKYLGRSHYKKEHKYVVETKHPYPYGKNQLKETVTIPGATAISLHFDPRSVTYNSSSDVLQLFLTASLDQPLTKDGNPVYFSGTNFPITNLVVPGETVTFVFTSNTHPEPGVATRWGFRCVVSELVPASSFQPFFAQWSLDLECMLSLLSSNCAASLVSGDALSESEKTAEAWLSSGLFGGGLEEMAPDHDHEAMKWLQLFVEDIDSAPHQFWNWLKQINASRPKVMQPRSAKPIERAERYAIATMLKHLGLVKEAQVVLQKLASAEPIPNDTRAKFVLLARQTWQQVGQWIHQRSQIEADWQLAVMEGQGMEFFDSFKEAPQRLAELCSVKNIDFDLMEEGETIKNLYTKLKSEIEVFSASDDKTLPNPYDVISRPVVERLKLLLLKVAPSCGSVQHPSAQSANPFSEKIDPSAITRLRGSLELRTLNSESESDVHPLSQSMTLPATTGASERARGKVTERKDGEAFSQRVGELRSWINSYHRWKSWQDGGLLLQSKHKHDHSTLPQTPVQAITSFVTTASDGLSPKDWETVLRSQHSRATARLHGIKYYYELLKLSSFGSVLHQVLGSLSEPIRGGGHYLLGISSCGHPLSAKVTNAFSGFFQTMVNIVGNPTHDSLTRQLAMGVCGLAFTDYDVHLLQAASVFPTLQSILSSKTNAGVSGEAMDEDGDITDSNKEKKTLEDERKKLEARRQSNLRASAWTSFRLLAMQCTNWSQRGDALLHDNSAVLQLQSQVFDLMCDELKRLSSGLSKRTGHEKTNSVSEEDDQQCYQLLSLLFVLGSASSARLKSLANAKNLQSLVSMLGTNISPRSQRLVLRLCRRLLPVQRPEAIGELVGILFNEMGSLLVNEKITHGVDPKPSKMEVEADEKKGTSSADSDSESESESKGKDSSYSVYLHQWSAGDKRLLETCTKTLGPNSLPTGSGSPKISTLLNEMSIKGSVLLKTGTQDQCTRLASALAELGGTVSLTKAVKEGEAHKKTTESPNEEQTKHWPVFWIAGHTASSLLSEYVSLLRLLAEVPEWCDTLSHTLRANLSLLPAAVTELHDSEVLSVNYHHILASLSILGGFQETVRVGASVRVRGDGGDVQTGTVVSYSSGDAKLDVIFTTDEDPQPIHRVPLDSVVPQSEVPIPPTLLASLSKTSMDALLSVLTTKKTPANSRWLFSEIVVRSMSVLQEMLHFSESAAALLRAGKDKLTLILEMANEYKSLPNTDLFAKNRRDLAHRLWNAYTTPLSNVSNWARSPMVALLPHLPFNKKADVLPTTFHISKVPGIVFSGQDKRSVEFVAVKASGRPRAPGGFSRGLASSQRERQTEVLVTGNVPVSTDMDYYFEVTIEKADSSSIISVGLTTEANLNGVVWDAGSYRYQANGQKRRGTSHQEPYGSYYRSKNTIGVGWSADAKSIYFTRDGVDLGSAFPGAFNPGERFLPAVGLGKGVKLRINFGQEPFVFLLKPDSELDAEVLAAKQKEAAKALAEELERQKQAAEAEKQRRIQEAQSLMAMGFTLNQAIKAIEATGDNGERAVNWLIENMDRIEDEPEAPEEAESPAQPVPEQEEESRSEEGEEIIDGPPEASYKEKYSSQFVLDRCCAFDPVYEKGPQKPAIPPGWENHIIPEMKILMEKDGYQQYEILPFIQEMKNKLAEELEEEAVKMYRHVVGQDPNPIYRMKQAVEETEAPLKIEQIRIGARYTVKEFSVDTASPKLLKHWTKDLSSTAGQTGTVRAIEHKTELVLLSFYNSENARMEEWWYPIFALSRPSRKQDTTSISLWSDLETPLEDLQKQDFEAKTKLSCVYARRLLLLLLKHVPLTLDENSPLHLVKMLNLASYENLSSPSVLASAFPLLAQRNSTFHRRSLAPPAQAQIDESGMEIFREKLKDLYGSLKTLEEVNDLTTILSTACTSAIVDSLKQHKKASSMELDKTKIGATVPFEVKGATSLLLIFDRSCNFPANSSAELALFSNEQCTELIKSIHDMRSLTPLLVPFGKMWVRFTAKSEQSSCKYKFTAIPLSSSFPMARWTFEFLLNYCLDTDLDLSTLFHVCLDLIYSCNAPSVTKEAIFILLSQTIYRLRRRPDKAHVLSLFPFKRVSKLVQEAQHLYEFETKQGSLLSTYLQSLIDFVVACKMYTVPRKDTKKPISFSLPTETPQKVPQTDDKEDDLTLVAIALYNAIQKDSKDTTETTKPTETEQKAETKEAEKPKSASPSSDSEDVSDQENEGGDSTALGIYGGFGDDGEDYSDEDDDDEDALARAIAESLKTVSAEAGDKPTEETPPQPVGEHKEPEKTEEKDEKKADLPKSEPQVPVPDHEMDLYGDEDDEALKRALALSMQSTAEEEAKPEEEKPADAAKDNEGPGPSKQGEPVSPPPSAFSFGSPDVSFTQSLSNALRSSTPSTPSTPSNPTVAQSKPPPPPAMKKKKAQMPWLADLLEVTNYLEFFAVTAANRGKQIVLDEYQRQNFEKIVKQACAEVKKETIKDCLVVITNIPTVEESKRNDLIWLLQDEIENHASVVPDSIFLPVDPVTKETKPWCIVELRCKDSVNVLCTKLPKTKFKLPPQWKIAPTEEAPTDPSPESKSSAKHDGKLVASRFKALENEGNEYVKEYLRFFLSEGTPDSAPAPLTSICRNMVREIFVRFAGSEDGVLGSEDFDRLQMVCLGEPFGTENYAGLCEEHPQHFKTVARQVRVPLKLQEMDVEPPSQDKGKQKEVKEENEISYTTEEKQIHGLTLDGFYEMWARQCQRDNPSATWSEFTNLGYDLHMQKNHFTSVEDALAVVFPTNTVDSLKGIDVMALDQEIVKSVDSLFSNIADLKTPLQLQHSQIMPLTNPLEYSNVDCRILRLRFEIIKQFNSLLLKTLPLINLEGHGMLSKYMFFCRSLIFHSVKMEFFDTILDKTAVKSAQPKVAINRLKMADTTEKRDPKQQITTDWLLNNTSFGVAFSQLRHTNPEGYRQRKPTGTEPHFSLLVDFPGENVEGEAGPYRQFFTDVSKELQQSDLLPLLVPCPNAQAKHGANRDKFVCTPSSNNRLYMKMYRFVGQLMGMAIRTGVMLTLDLPSFVWKPLVGVPNSLQDLKDIDHSFYFGVLEFLHGCTKDEFDASFFDEKFQVTLSDMTKRLLLPGGDKVALTFENKSEYLSLAERVRLEEAKHQVNAIRQGLADVVPLPLLNLCTPEDLEVSVCGRPTIDVKLLKRHTEYSGVSPTSPHIIYFWQVLQSFDQEQRRAFVRFAWAQERLPTDDLAFTRRNTRMLIKPYTGTANPDKAFPKADTCFFNLMLPEYTTPNTLRTQLLTAIYTDADSMNADNPQDEEAAQNLRSPPSGFGFADYF